MKKTLAFIIVIYLFFGLSGCEKALGNSSDTSENEESNISGNVQNDLNEASSAQHAYERCLITSGIEPFEEGEAVKVNAFLLYFELFEMRTETGALKEIYEPYKVDGEMYTILIPKEIVHAELKKHFAVDFKAGKTEYDAEDENYYLLEAEVRDGPGIYETDNVNLEDKDGETTVITCDKKSVKSLQSESEDPEYIYEKSGEIEIGIRNYGKDDFQYIYITEKSHCKTGS